MYVNEQCQGTTDTQHSSLYVTFRPRHRVRDVFTLFYPSEVERRKKLQSTRKRTFTLLGRGSVCSNNCHVDQSGINRFTMEERFKGSDFLKFLPCFVRIARF